MMPLSSASGVKLIEAMRSAVSQGTLRRTMCDSNFDGLPYGFVRTPEPSERLQDGTFGGRLSSAASAFLLIPAPASTPPASSSPFLRKSLRSATGSFCPSAATFCKSPNVVGLSDATQCPQGDQLGVNTIRSSCILENSNIKEKC